MTPNNLGEPNQPPIDAKRAWLSLIVVLILALIIGYGKNREIKFDVNKQVADVIIYSSDDYSHGLINSSGTHSLVQSDDTHDTALSNFLDDHDLTQSAKDNGTHEKAVSDFIDDHDTTISIQEDKDNGTHEKAVSDFFDDHDTTISIQEDKANGTHDEELSVFFDSGFASDDLDFNLNSQSNINNVNNSDSGGIFDAITDWFNGFFNW
ncbi:MAG: hypothetical protein WC250_02280 [Candidatus Paceibacterota bacterium]|jgi:hypothetical protein